MPKRFRAILLLAMGWLSVGGCDRPTTSPPVGDSTSPINTRKSSLSPQPQGQPVIGLADGNLAPEIEGQDSHGRTFKLSDYRGKVVLLDFWAMWCGPCRAAFPHARSRVNRLRDRPFVMLGINADPNQKTLREAEDKKHVNWMSWWDAKYPRQGSIIKNYRISGFPSFYLLDHRGVIRYQSLGEPAHEILDALIEELLREAEADRKSPKDNK